MFERDYIMVNVQSVVLDSLTAGPATAATLAQEAKTSKAGVRGAINRLRARGHDIRPLSGPGYRNSGYTLVPKTTAPSQRLADESVNA